MKKNTKKLGKLSAIEMELMEALWQQGTVTVAQLVAQFESTKGWKTSTIATMLDRIMAKGFLEKQLQGKANYYHPTISQADYKAQEGREVITNLYGGSILNFMAALVDDGGITQSDITELSQWFSTLTVEE